MTYGNPGPSQQPHGGYGAATGTSTNDDAYRQQELTIRRLQEDLRNVRSYLLLLWTLRPAQASSRADTRTDTCVSVSFCVVADCERGLFGIALGGWAGRRTTSNACC